MPPTLTPAASQSRHSLENAPDCMQVDEYSAADSARRRLNVLKPRIFPFSCCSSPQDPPSSLFGSMLEAIRKRSTESQVSEAGDASLSVELPRPESCQIQLDRSAISGAQDKKDEYRWAIIYENQRGVTLFSTPYYSALSLLPIDPSPFTLPDASVKRANQPDVSLNEYPLPDGTWRWVSKAWMIDMRSDSGEVQHDGFEYNWMFRKHKWRAEVGFLSAGGWVRRRRWVRLMIHPAQTSLEEINLPDPDTLNREPWMGVKDPTSSSVSVFNRNLLCDPSMVNVDEVWLGEDAESDWTRCNLLMKRLGRDGRKLELWRSWLGQICPDIIDKQESEGKLIWKQWAADGIPLPLEINAAQIEITAPSTIGKATTVKYMARVLSVHGNSLLRSFTFPESRAQFIELLHCVGLRVN